MARHIHPRVNLLGTGTYFDVLVSCYINICQVGLWTFHFITVVGLFRILVFYHLYQAILLFYILKV